MWNLLFAIILSVAFAGHAFAEDPPATDSGGNDTEASPEPKKDEQESATGNDPDECEKYKSDINRCVDEGHAYAEEVKRVSLYHQACQQTQAEYDFANGRRMRYLERYNECVGKLPKHISCPTLGKSVQGLKTKADEHLGPRNQASNLLPQVCSGDKNKIADTEKSQDTCTASNNASCADSPSSTDDQPTLVSAENIEMMDTIPVTQDLLDNPNQITTETSKQPSPVYPVSSELREHVGDDIANWMESDPEIRDFYQDRYNQVHGNANDPWAGAPTVKQAPDTGESYYQVGENNPIGDNPGSGATDSVPTARNNDLGQSPTPSETTPALSGSKEGNPTVNAASTEQSNILGDIPDAPPSMPAQYQTPEYAQLQANAAPAVAALNPDTYNPSEFLNNENYQQVAAVEQKEDWVSRLWDGSKESDTTSEEIKALDSPSNPDSIAKQGKVNEWKPKEAFKDPTEPNCEEGQEDCSEEELSDEPETTKLSFFDSIGNSAKSLFNSLLGKKNNEDEYCDDDEEYCEEDEEEFNQYANQPKPKKPVHEPSDEVEGWDEEHLTKEELAKRKEMYDVDEDPLVEAGLEEGIIDQAREVGQENPVLAKTLFDGYYKEESDPSKSAVMIGTENPDDVLNYDPDRMNLYKTDEKTGTLSPAEAPVQDHPSIPKLPNQATNYN